MLPGVPSGTKFGPKIVSTYYAKMIKGDTDFEDQFNELIIRFIAIQDKANSLSRLQKLTQKNVSTKTMTAIDPFVERMTYVQTATLFHELESLRYEFITLRGIGPELSDMPDEESNNATIVLIGKEIDKEYDDLCGRVCALQLSVKERKEQQTDYNVEIKALKEEDRKALQEFLIRLSEISDQANDYQEKASTVYDALNDPQKWALAQLGLDTTDTREHALNQLDIKAAADGTDFDKPKGNLDPFVDKVNELSQQLAQQLKDNLDNFESIDKDAIASFTSTAKTVTEPAISVFEKLRSMFDKVVEFLGAIYDKIVAGIASSIKGVIDAYNEMQDARKMRNAYDKLSKSKDPTLAAIGEYAYRKTYRAFITRLASFLGMCINKILAVLTLAYPPVIGMISLAFDVFTRIMELGAQLFRVAKGFWKWIKNTKGVNRKKNATKVYDLAVSSSSSAINALGLLVELEIFKESWWGKLTSKVKSKLGLKLDELKITETITSASVLTFLTKNKEKRDDVIALIAETMKSY